MTMPGPRGLQHRSGDGVGDATDQSKIGDPIYALQQADCKSASRT
jgi:hypothetical protein